MTEKKHLNLQVLNKLDSKHHEKKEIHLEIEYQNKIEPFVLYIDQTFRPSKIRECVEEFIQKMDALRKINRQNYLQVGEAYLIFMVIKHFSSFPAPDLLDEQVKVMQMLSDNGLLYRIYAYFDADQLFRVQKEVRDFAEQIEEHVELYVNLAEEMGIPNLEE